MSRLLTLFSAATIIGSAILFQLLAGDTPIIVVALQIASFTYDGLLGGLLLGILSRRAEQRDAITGMATANGTRAVRSGLAPPNIVGATSVIYPDAHSLSCY